MTGGAGGHSSAAGGLALRLGWGGGLPGPVGSSDTWSLRSVFLLRVGGPDVQYLTKGVMEGGHSEAASRAAGRRIVIKIDCQTRTGPGGVHSFLLSPLLPEGLGCPGARSCGPGQWLEISDGEWQSSEALIVGLRGTRGAQGGRRPLLPLTRARRHLVVVNKMLRSEVAEVDESGAGALHRTFRSGHPSGDWPRAPLLPERVMGNPERPCC